jgi:hypothetical protein
MYAALVNVLLGGVGTLIGALMVAWRRRQRDRKTAAQRRAEERLNSIPFK